MKEVQADDLPADGEQRPHLTGNCGECAHEPIEVGGEVIGAVAAGGAKIEQDVEVAKAALAALTLP